MEDIYRYTATTEDPMTKRLEQMYKELENPTPRNREERRAQMRRMKKKRR